jgi:hypothetical protein
MQSVAQDVQGSGVTEEDDKHTDLVQSTLVGEDSDVSIVAS